MIFTLSLLVVFLSPQLQADNSKSTQKESDKPSLITIKSNQSQALRPDEAKLIETYGGINASRVTYTIKVVCLKQLTKPYYKDVDETAKEVLKAQKDNKDKLGLLGFGPIKPDGYVRIVYLNGGLGGPHGVTSNPTPFGQQLGFPITCIVSTTATDIEGTVLHELTHAAVIWDGSESSIQSLYIPFRVNLLDSRFHYNYFSPIEIDPRLAEVKRVYCKLTKNTVYNIGEAQAAWEWALKNPEKFGWFITPWDVRTGNITWLQTMDILCQRHVDVTYENLFRRMCELL